LKKVKVTLKKGVSVVIDVHPDKNGNLISKKSRTISGKLIETEDGKYHLHTSRGYYILRPDMIQSIKECE